MSTKGTLTITIRRPDGEPTIYFGEAEWHTDSVPMILKSGPPLEGFKHLKGRDLEWHASICRTAALALGLDTEEDWYDEGFQGGRQR